MSDDIEAILDDILSRIQCKCKKDNCEHRV